VANWPPSRDHAAETGEPEVRPVVLWTLCLLVMSLPFELPNRTFRVETVTMADGLFLLATLRQPELYLANVPRGLPWFLVWLLVFVLDVLFLGAVNYHGIGHEFLLMVQAILTFWAAATVLRSDHVARRVLWCFVIACIVRSALPLVGVGRTVEMEWTGGVRITAFGQNANSSAVILGSGLLALVGLTYTHLGAGARHRLLTWPLFALLGYAIIASGSRGGLLSLGVGLLVFMFSGRTPWAQIRNVATAVVALGFLLWASYNTEVMRNRLEDTAQTGTLAGRERLYPILWQMFLEKPFAGWGPDNNQYELAIRENYRDFVKRDAHNLLLELMTAEGLIGAIPFLIGLAACTHSAWQARRGPHGLLPFALIATLLTSNVSGNRVAAKVFWFVLAYAVARGAVAATTPLALADETPELAETAA
jgi:O-antigen ligase